MPETFITEEPTKDPLVLDYLRHNRLPTTFCYGCGLGIVTRNLAKALATANVEKDNLVMVSGIGCSGRVSIYFDTNTLHTTHGRALAFATGVKMANPKLKVIAIMGDGDCLAIGGNHFIHACRRNIDLTAIVCNNENYGLTSGQFSPTTRPGKKTTTSPMGHIENNFDPCKLAIAAGATYVARTSVFHYQNMHRLLAKAIQHKGFSVVEIKFNCHVYFGRYNGMEAADMLLDFKQNAVPYKEGVEGTLNPDQFTVGELLNIERPEYSEEYAKLIARSQGVAK